MKLIEKIFKQDSEGLLNCEIFYNEEISKGLVELREQTKKHLNL